MPPLSFPWIFPLFFSGDDSCPPNISIRESKEANYSPSTRYFFLDSASFFVSIFRKGRHVQFLEWDLTQYKVYICHSCENFLRTCNLLTHWKPSLSLSFPPLQHPILHLRTLFEKPCKNGAHVIVDNAHCKLQTSSPSLDNYIYNVYTVGILLSTYVWFILIADNVIDRLTEFDTSRNPGS